MTSENRELVLSISEIDNELPHGIERASGGSQAVQEIKPAKASPFLEYSRYPGKSEIPGKTEASSSDAYSSYEGFLTEVPALLRSVDKEAFEPSVVPIGPYHHHKKTEFAIKEENKLQVIDYLFGINTMDERKSKVEDLIHNMKEQEEKIRKCYSEPFSRISSDDFSRMIVLDGCFIIGLLHFFTETENNGGFPSVPIISTLWMLPSIKLDLLKFDNQIPFIVLKDLRLSLCKLGCKRSLPCIDAMAIKFFASQMPGEVEKKSTEHQPRTTVRSLLELFHSMVNPKYKHLSNCTKIGVDAEPHTHSPSRASKLWLRGILLKKRNSGDIMSVSCRDGLVEVPCLKIEQTTVSILRNMLAYEQVNVCTESRVTHYLFFLDALVDTANDLAFLTHKGIIHHSLGSDEEVTRIINSLTKGILNYKSEDCFLCQLDKNTVPNHCGIRLSQSLSEFLIFALLHPLSFVNFFIGLLALYFAIIQTTLAVFESSKSSSSK